MEKIDGINSELLESLYHGNGYSTYEIADLFGCSDEVIRARMIEHDIPRRWEVIIEPELLESLYWGNEYTTLQIADKFGCCDVTIGNRMKEYGIPRRSSGIRVTGFTFNGRQKEILEGCMLGDGGLYKHGINYYFCNFDAHKEYLVWLQNHLGIENFSKVMPRYRFVRDDVPYGYRFWSKVIPSIRGEHKKWYPDGKGTINNPTRKIIPKDIKLTPIKVLFWYIGDGNYNKRDTTARFTNSLIFEEWLPLSKKISKVLNVDDGLSINKDRKDKKGVQKYYLRLNKVATSKFFDMVDSLGFDIPDCYLYKFGKEKLCQNEN